MIKISKEKVLLLQQLMIAETGGSAGVRDFNLLDAALECAFITFDKKELYPSKEEKAAKMKCTPKVRQNFRRCILLCKGRNTTQNTRQSSRYLL